MNTERPLVSLGIPVYNGENTIRDALNALLAQTYDNLELVISDNASTDRTSEICQEYASKDSRIKYFRNRRNLGVTANFRRVLALATGEYFMWAAVDDVKPPDAVEVCLRALRKNPRAVLAHGSVLVRARGLDQLIEFRNVVQASNKSAAARVRLFTLGIEHNAMIYGLYRLNDLKRATFGNHMGQDYLLCLQMYLLGEVEYVGVPLIIFYQSQGTTASASNPGCSFRRRSLMYREVPLTLRVVITANKLQRRKCWTVLLMGAYYLASRRNVPVGLRWSAIASHVTAFSSLYRSLLAKEVVFQIFEPLAWVSIHVWRLACKWPPTFRFTRKVKALFSST